MAKKNPDVETPESDETTETTAPETTAPETKAAKPPIDLTAFDAAVESTLNETDGAELDDDHLAEITEEFGKLEGRAKTAARKAIRDRILSILDEDDPSFDAAQLLGKINTALENYSPTKPKSERAAKAPVDPTEAHVKKGAVLMTALTLHGQTPAEGVADDAQSQIEQVYNDSYAGASTYLDWLNGGKEGDEPEVSDVSKDAAKLVLAKKVRSSGGGGGGVRTYSGPARSVAKHIEQAFEGVESGTHLTVGEIAKVKTAEYGDDKPSQGAISGALRSAKFDVAGVKPDADGTTPFGATKA